MFCCPTDPSLNEDMVEEKAWQHVAYIRPNRLNRELAASGSFCFIRREWNPVQQIVKYRSNL